jgi:hypothetical protein
MMKTKYPPYSNKYNQYENYLFSTQTSNPDIFDAISKNDLTLVYDLLTNYSINVNIPDKDGQIPLLLVWNMNFDFDDYVDHEIWIQIIKKLIQNTSSVNVKDNLGNTPLYYAFLYDEPHIVTLLQQKGADMNDINIVDSDGNTLLHNALLDLNETSYRKIKFFLTYSPNLNIKNKEGKTPLDIAKERNLVQYVRLLSAPKNIQTNIETTNIYFPNGHGFEECSKKRKVVPDDCVFVSFTQCGIMTQIEAEGYKSIINDIQTNEVLEKYAKPVQNRERIMETIAEEFKGVSYFPDIRIKTPGMTLPNIIYELLNNFDNNSFYIYSGLIPYTNVKQPLFHPDIIYSPGEISIDYFKLFIPSLFRFSIFPTEEEVQKAFQNEESIIQSLPKVKVNGVQITADMLKTKKKEYLIELSKVIRNAPIFKTTLYDLMKRFPGVYYHTACRSTCCITSNANINTNECLLNQHYKKEVQQLLKTRRLSTTEQLYGIKQKKQPKKQTFKRRRFERKKRHTRKKY